MGSWGYGTRNAVGERILEVGEAMNMIVCNTAPKKSESKLITYQAGGSSSHISYFLDRRSDQRLVNDVKVTASKKGVHQHRWLIFNLIWMNSLRKSAYVPRRKIQKLKDQVI